MTETTPPPVVETTTTPVPEATVPPVVHTTATPGAYVKGNWYEQKGKLKTQFPVLTDADLHYDNGKKDEMFTRIQEKIGKSKKVKKK